MPLLEARDLGVQYRTRRGPAHALDDVSFAVERGQMLGVVGESGCGKTTLGLALMGLLAETATVTGQVLFDGRDVSRLSEEAWRRLRGKDIGMVFQGAMNAWNPVYPIGDQIIEAILAHDPRLRGSEARARVEELFKTVGLRADCIDDFPHQYSGGMKQRAVIAMALACNPKLVIADEPTTALDVIVQHEILRELRELRRDRDFSMIYISHDMAVVAELVDVVAVMYAGRIVEMGPVERIFSRPTHPYTAALLAASPTLHGSRKAIRGLGGGPPGLVDPPPGCRFAERCSYATERCRVESPPLAAQRDDLVAACWHPVPIDDLAASETVTLEAASAAAADAEGSAHPIVQLEHVSKVFTTRGSFLGRATQHVHAVDDVTLEIAPGEALGLVGGSGSGKTTLGRMLVGLGEATGGTIRLALNGTPAILDQLDRRVFRRHVQMIFQDPYESLNPRMTIGAIVAEPLDVLRIDAGGARAERVARMLERVGLTPARRFVERYPHELSGGQRQRVAIARAMIVEPTLVVADEPTSMLDVSVRAGIMDLLLDLKRDFGVAYLYITHDLAVARYVCDRVAVMYRGKLVELGGTEAVLQNPQHPYTRALIASVPAANGARHSSEPDILLRARAVADADRHCRFLSRCPTAITRCETEAHPPLRAIEVAHFVSCIVARSEGPITPTGPGSDTAQPTSAPV